MIIFLLYKIYDYFQFLKNIYRADDYNDPIHLERISTLNMFETRDLGAIPTGKYISSDVS